MLGRRANKPGGGVAEQGKKIVAFDRVGHTETTIPSRLYAPPKLFLATSAAAPDEDEVAVPERAEAVLSPTSILQDGILVSPAARHVLSGGPVPFSRGGTGGVDRRSKGRSRRSWDVRPVGLGLAGALNGGEATGAATTTVLTGQTLRPVNAPSSKEFVGVNSCRNPTFAEPVGQYLARGCLLPSETEASEDYISVGSGRLSAGGGEGEFLRWCHGCGKDLGQGKDIFMYRGEMAFCSHECRYRKMLLHEKL